MKKRMNLVNRKVRNGFRYGIFEEYQKYLDFQSSFSYLLLLELNKFYWILCIFII